MTQQKNPFPIATAMRASMRGYNFATFKKDATAGLIVSLLALPLSMALSIAVGLPPQHGLYTAIVAGITAALLGGSNVQVSGPTAAFVVIVAPIVTEFGLHGLIWCTLMAGVVLIIMGSCRLGRYINFVPYPVTTGFTAGIAVVIATLALNDFLGLGIGRLTGSYINKVGLIAGHLDLLNPYELSIGMVTLLLILFFGKLTRAIPTTVVGITIGTLLGWLLSQYGIEIATIGSRFTYLTPQGLTGHGIPPYPPSLQPLELPTYVEFKTLLMPSLVIAVLAALESLLAATVSDSMTGTRHDPNAELNGIGVANILSGLVAGIPATGAIARTAANVHSGAKTPVAAIIHALLIMLYVILLAPLISFIPMTSLAALLLVTAWRMSHAKQFIRTIRIAPASDSVVLLTCFGLTVFVDMVAGVSVGIVLASILFMKRISEMTELNILPPGETYKYSNIALPENVMVYHIDGPLFFGTVEKALGRSRFVHDHITKLIIDMKNVPLIDMTGLVAMKSLLSSIARDGREIIICGRPEVTRRILLKISDHPLRQYVKTAASVKKALQAE